MCMVDWSEDGGVGGNDRAGEREKERETPGPLGIRKPASSMSESPSQARQSQISTGAAGQCCPPTHHARIYIYIYMHI